MSLVPKASVADDGSRKRLVDALLHRAKTKNINVEVTDEARDFGGGAYDRDSRSVKIAPKVQEGSEGPSTLAHELGHAEFDRTALGRAVQHPTARMMSVNSIPIGVIISILAEGSLARRVALSTGFVAASQVPLLTGEGVAWYKGHQMLKEHGASPEELAHLRSEAVRLGSTYLRPAAAGMGGTLMTSALSHLVNP